MRLTLCVAAALLFAGSAAAGTSVSVPAPAIGKVRVEMVSIKASGMPRLTVTNLAALGPGFDGVALVGKTKQPGVYAAYFVMFTGNASSTTAATVNVQVTNGAPVGKPADQTENCSVLDAIIKVDEGDRSALTNAFKIVANAIAYQPLKKSKSPPKPEVKSDVSYEASAAGCK